MNTSLTVTTLSGRTYSFVPVPMKKMPSQDPATWLKFQGQHVEGTRLADATQNAIQTFMRQHHTESLTDGTHNFTLAGGMLAYCDPAGR